MDFSSLDLHPDLKRGIAEMGYVTATLVQEEVIKHSSQGRDLYVQSQTGTGKTAAFLVVIFERLMNDASLKGRKALILAPTRELAVQIEEEANALARYLPLKTGAFYGGVGYGEQQRLLRNNCDVLVGTPGRVLDLNAGGEMNLMEISFLIIDEADRMFDMGFYPDLRRLIGVVPPPEKRQTMLFSATLNNYVKNLAWEYTREPIEIEIEAEHITVNEIEQLLYHVHSKDKFRLLLGIFKREEPESAIIFCNTKRYAEIVADKLCKNGIKCEYISGDLPQVKRLKIITNLKEGKVKILVATDVAARGLDVEDLSLVVNYDLPQETENYVHRIGRTARAGKSGKAITLATEQDVYSLADIEKYVEFKIPSVVASEDLFVEDAGDGSFGSRGDDDGYDRFRGRNAQRGDRGGRRRSEDARPSHSARERDNRRDNRKPFPAAKSAASTPQKRQQPPVQLHSDILSAMTSEERMAYYKEKYSKANAAPKVQTAPKYPTKRGTRGGVRQHNNRSPVNNAKQGTEGRRGKSGKYAQNAPAIEKSAAPKKGGVFGKIAALFKRK